MTTNNVCVTIDCLIDVCKSSDILHVFVGSVRAASSSEVSIDESPTRHIAIVYKDHSS